MEIKMSSSIAVLKQILQQKRETTAPTLSEDEYFNLFACEQALKDFELSYDEINKGIVDGPLDGGIDAIYTFVNGELLDDGNEVNDIKKDIVIDLIIVQSKNTTGFSEEAINKLIASANDLFNFMNELDGFYSTYNHKLLERVGLFKNNAYMKFVGKFPSVNISYYYAAVAADVHVNVLRKVDLHLESTVKTHITDCNFSFTFLDVNKLLTLARKKPINVKSLHVGGATINTADGGYISLVTLVNFNEFITDNKKLIKSFFDANVRDYQGKIEVNKAINDTLIKPTGEDFWWLNNGVTITTTKASLAGQLLTIEDPQIVNGLQSSHEIFNYFQSGGDTRDGRQIMVRVISPKDEKSRLKIIKATNSQTDVPIASLRATDRIHLDIEDFFSANGLFYDRRKNFYKNQGKQIDLIISIPLLSQIITAIVLREPDNSRARPSTLIKNDEEYQKIFNDEYKIEVYLCSVRIQKKVEHCLKNFSPELTTSTIGDLKFHVAMFTVMCELNKTWYHANEILKIDINSINDEKMANYIRTINEIYLMHGGTNKVAKGKDFVQTIFSKFGELSATKNSESI